MFIWRKIPCLISQLQLKVTLEGGQSFRWKPYMENDDKSIDSPIWIGVMGNCVWKLKQTDKHLMYKILGELPSSSSSGTDNNSSQIKMKIIKSKIKPNQSNTNTTTDTKKLLHDSQYYENLLKSYFRLDINLKEYYTKWSLAHKHFENEADRLYAVRVLNQQPVENLFSFICSQNNHINRISTLVEKLCSNYGERICEWNNVCYYTFPDCLQLAKPEVEGELREAKFGYRAKFIQQSANEIVKKGNLEWFSKLQLMDYKDAHAELIKLPGIGPKVADCICLMSLNHLQAIPVDTHVYQIAVQHYLPHLKNKTKSVTPSIYLEIGDHLRKLYGPMAGWAQTVLFCADLDRFQPPTKKKKMEK